MQNSKRGKSETEQGSIGSMEMIVNGVHTLKLVDQDDTILRTKSSLSTAKIPDIFAIVPRENTRWQVACK